MIAIYNGFDRQVRSYITRVEPTLEKIAEERLHDLALAIARKFRSLVEFAKPMEFWRGMMRTVDSLDHREGPSPRKGKRKKKGRGKDGSESEEDDEEDEVEDYDDDEMDD